MALAQTAARPDDAVAGAFRNGAESYKRLGSPLYAALCAGGANDAELIDLASHAQKGSQPVYHVLASVHYMLLRDPNDPLSQYFATIVDNPAPPEQAYPAFAAFCRTHRDEILQLLATRTVQTTYVERCTGLVSPLTWVADKIGEPLNLIEIGCSAGVLLTFDKYAYDFKDRGVVGPANAPLTLTAEVRGGPPVRVPKIGTRIGLDLHTINVRSPEERRWIIALTFPEFREQRARLATALDVVAQTDIRLYEGDALKNVATALAETRDPVCIFHSACLYYWSDEARAALDEVIASLSKDREIYRIGLEASAQFLAWHKGRSSVATKPSNSGGELTIAHYHKGKMESRVAGRTDAQNGILEWTE